MADICNGNETAILALLIRLQRKFDPEFDEEAASHGLGMAKDESPKSIHVESPKKRLHDLSDPEACSATETMPPPKQCYKWQYIGFVKGLYKVTSRFYGFIGAITIIATILKFEDITLEIGHHTPPLHNIPKHRPSDDPTRLALYNSTMAAISQLSETSERVCQDYNLPNCAVVTPWANLRPNDGVYTVATYLWGLEFAKVMQGFEDSVNSTETCADWRLAAARAAVVYETRETAYTKLPLPLGQSLEWELHLGPQNYTTSCGTYQMPALYAQLASIIGARFNSSAAIRGLPTGMLTLLIDRDALIGSYPMIGASTSKERIILQVFAKTCY